LEALECFPARRLSLSRRRASTPTLSATRAIVTADAIADVVARQRPIVEPSRLLVATRWQAIRRRGAAILTGSSGTRSPRPVLIAH